MTPTIGDEAEQPRGKTDQEAEIQADHHQPGRIDQVPRIRQVSPCPRMKAAIARSISRASWRISSTWSRGSQRVDPGDHPVPVVEDVEGDDGRDDEQRDDVEQGLSAVPQRSEDAR